MQMSRRYATLTVASLALVALTCVAFLVPVPYVTMRPGPVFNTLGDFGDQPMITIGADAKTYPTSGALDFTTVAVSRSETDVSLSTAILTYFDEQNAVVPRSLIYPEGESAKESSAQSARQLSNSVDNSKAAALRAAGYDVGERPGVASVAVDGPALGKLQAGDLIAAVDGERTESSKEVAELVRSHQPGEPVTFTVLRDGDKKKIEVTTEPSPDDADVARVGITLGQQYTFPFDVENNVDESIGGPSAGTMFALAIYDKLTRGDLTGERHIAGTGVITGDGEVGPIGGIRQKMAGAAAAGAEIFLVPAKNCEEATQGDDFGLQLVKISDLEVAIDALDELAADRKAEVPTCS